MKMHPLCSLILVIGISSTTLGKPASNNGLSFETDGKDDVAETSTVTGDVMAYHVKLDGIDPISEPTESEVVEVEDESISEQTEKEDENKPIDEPIQTEDEDENTMNKIEKEVEVESTSEQIVKEDEDKPTDEPIQTEDEDENTMDKTEKEVEVESTSEQIVKEDEHIGVPIQTEVGDKTISERSEEKDMVIFNVETDEIVPSRCNITVQYPISPDYSLIVEVKHGQTNVCREDFESVPKGADCKNKTTKCKAPENECVLVANYHTGETRTWVLGNGTAYPTCSGEIPKNYNKTITCSEDETLYLKCDNSPEAK